MHGLAVQARNVGLARQAGAQALLAAGARWLAFTDADSEVADDWLVAQLRHQQAGADAVCGCVTVDGKPVGRPTAPITWGGVGTDAQHAVFQLLHQGTHLVPVEFIAVIEPGDTLAEDHHRQLLLNAFAQGAALMKGKQVEDPARSYSGDRPSSTILLDVLDPRTLGALIAFYEHRVFVNGVLLGINSFDQFGVELGKEMAKAADQGGQEFDPSTEDLIRRAGLD